MSKPKSNPQLVLRPQDVVVLLRLSIKSQAVPTYAKLAEELKLTASETHASVERAVAAQLAIKSSAGKPSVLIAPFHLFVQHGLRYCFPATRGQMTRGMLTGYAAPVMSAKIAQPNEPPPVWPYKSGTVRGAAFYPLYPTVPEAASGNAELYELLVLVDCIRGGSNRERALAIAELDKRWLT
jgi:hypothetical protein